ncbi:MAG TPA: SUMF1/EgtB/PvdO family nonheme iron enzyme [Anaerolineae bacterium]|nr:SUMF1/EgtB/PvdO family nonheme iron enzyme [Anaerolineae bacterium]
MGEIILVVDDNPDLVDGVKLTLEMEGFQVLTALSGQEALDILQRITPDLILADIMMPNLDGYELYVRVHNDERWLHVPFIFLTAKTSKEDIRKGKEMGADDYITKPFDPQDLVAVVRGKLKRIAELTGRYAPGSLRGMVRAFWRGKFGPFPFPLLALFLLALIIGATMWLTRTLGGGPLVTPPAEEETLRSDVGGMVTVSGGRFILGSDVPGATPRQEVNLPTFKMDKYEVTYAQYQVFVAETGRAAPWGTYPTERAAHPVGSVAWEDARAYCEWAGKRLPTSAEWEKAARGAEGFIYPWGNTWKEGLANTKEAAINTTQAVGSYPDGASPYGALDMAGNVWEWVDDWAEPEQSRKIIRGGAWNAIADWTQAYKTNAVRPTETRDYIGFRCAR